MKSLTVLFYLYKCNIHIYNTALQPIYRMDIILTSLVLVHAGYLFVTDTLSTTTITKPPSVECQDLKTPHKSICELSE